MQFLSDVTLDCPDCEGRSVWSGSFGHHLEWAECCRRLELTITEARDVFRDYHDIYGPLKALVDVGLGLFEDGSAFNDPLWW